MTHSLHVLVRLPARPGPIRLEVEGCLTEDSCQDLVRLLDHGTTLAGCTHILVDLFSLDHMEPSGVAALKTYAKARQNSGDPCPQISVYAPSMSRPCPAKTGTLESVGARMSSKPATAGPL